MKVCSKCNNNIPTRCIIDGKVRFLKNRKLCLECSPFGTSKGGRQLNSNLSKYQKLSTEIKKKHIDRVLQKGRDRKQILLEAAGGKCMICGYDKVRQALEFHHLERSTKCFGLNVNEIKNRSWDDVLEEFKKCVLVCCRCHVEIEAGLISAIPLIEIDTTFITDVSYTKEPTLKSITKECQFCNKLFYLKERTQRFCSKNCVVLFKESLRPSKEKLQQMIVDKTISEIGLIYGVSDGAVRKWISRYQISI
jgi:hypothetical protein